MQKKLSFRVLFTLILVGGLSILSSTVAAKSPDYVPRLTLSNTNFVGSKGSAEFKIIIKEKAGGVNIGDLRFTLLKSNVKSIQPIDRDKADNNDWTMRDLGSLYLFTYEGKDGIFPAKGRSKIKLDASYVFHSSAEGRHSEVVTIASGSGEKNKNRFNNRSSVQVEYSNIVGRDSDFDGYTNFEENIAGTNAFDPNDVPTLPDYKITASLRGSIVGGAIGNFTLNIRVAEYIDYGLNTGDLVVSIPRENITLTKDTSLNSTDWSITQTNSHYLLKYTKNQGKFTPYTQSKLLLNGVFTSPDRSGTFEIKSTILDGSGDINAMSNTDSEYITYRNLH